MFIMNLRTRKKWGKYLFREFLVFDFFWICFFYYQTRYHVMSLPSFKNPQSDLGAF